MIIIIPKVENPIHGTVNVFKDIIQEMKKKTQFVLKKYTVFQKTTSDSECVKPRNFWLQKYFMDPDKKSKLPTKW